MQNDLRICILILQGWSAETSTGLLESTNWLLIRCCHHHIVPDPRRCCVNDFKLQGYVSQTASMRSTVAVFWAFKKGSICNGTYSANVVAIVGRTTQQPCPARKL